MTSFTATDYEHMARALRLAERGLHTTDPNPRVGCVLAKDGRIVGEGWHAAAGEAHAEVVALDAAAGDARGATAYVTLEPCAHEGRTAPCSDALIEAGVARVVGALRDPNPAVSGRGFAALEAAGIRTGCGLLETAARALNPGFLSRFERGRPFVRVKVAVSLDGASAMATGESRWVTGEAARRDVQRLRARSSAILTGIGTVTADDPSLTVREPGLVRRQPLRVVVDSRLGLSPSARLLAEEGDTLVVGTATAGADALERAGATVLAVAAGSDGVDLAALLALLAERAVNEVLVEAGPRLTGAFLAAGLADELVIYQAPHIMGSATRRLADTPGWSALADRLALDVVERRRIGADLRIIARPRRRERN